MRKFCLIFFGAAAGIVMFGSCKKYYESVPVEAVTSDYIWDTKDSNGIYASEFFVFYLCIITRWDKPHQLRFLRMLVRMMLLLQKQRLRQSLCWQQTALLFLAIRMMYGRTVTLLSVRLLTS